MSSAASGANSTGPRYSSSTMGACRSATTVSSIFFASPISASRVGNSSCRATMNTGLRLSRIPSAACAELLNCTLKVVFPHRVTVPSEFTRYSLIAENLADAVTDCTSGYCLYRLVTSSRVFFQPASSTFSVAVCSTAIIGGAFAKSSTGFGSALNCFIAACFSARACPAAECSIRPGPCRNNCLACNRRCAQPLSARERVCADSRARLRKRPPRQNPALHSRDTRRNTAPAPDPFSVGPWSGPIPSTMLRAARRPSPPRGPRASPHPAQHSPPRLPPGSARYSEPANTQSPIPAILCKRATLSRGEVFSWLQLCLHLRIFGRAGIFKSRWRQERRTFMLMRALLHLHLGKQHRRRHRRNRNLPALGATYAVKDPRLVSSCENPGQRCQRRAHNVHSAHQFIRAPVGIHLVHNHRQHLERLRQRARRQRKSALNIVEVQPVWFPLLLHLINQFLPHVRFGHRLCRRDDQVSLASRWHPSRLVSPMPIRLPEILDRHPRHEKILQHAVFDHIHALRRLPLIVEVIRARQVCPCQVVHRRVVAHAQEFRQHFLPDLLRERLSFLFIALPVAFQPVPQHFMKKNGRRAPAQYRRSIVRLRHRCLAQRAQVRRHFLDLARQFRFAW